MRLSISLLLLFFCVPLWAGSKSEPSYPLVVIVVRTDVSSSQGPGKTNTNCAANGEYTNCTTTTSAAGTTMTGRQLIRFGSEYEVDGICRSGLGRSVLSGVGGAMGGTSYVGCNLPTGEYPARFENGVLHLRFVNRKGKVADLAFDTSPPRPISLAPAEKTKPGILTVSSTPSGADIWLDGKFVGQTGATLPLSAGQHAITIRHDGFKPWERSVLVIENSAISLSAELVP